MPNVPSMTARHHSFASKRRKRVVVGLFLSIISLVLVDCVQIPTHRKAQEPDAAPYNDDYGVFAPENDVDDEASPKEQNGATRAQAPRIPQDAPSNSYQDFMTWCTQVLGIQTSLEIKDFEYEDFMRIRMANEDDVDEELCDPQEEFPPVSVRGLAATKDIQVGVSSSNVKWWCLVLVVVTFTHTLALIISLRMWSFPFPFMHYSPFPPRLIMILFSVV